MYRNILKYSLCVIIVNFLPSFYVPQMWIIVFTNLAKITEHVTMDLITIPVIAVGILKDETVKVGFIPFFY